MSLKMSNKHLNQTRWAEEQFNNFGYQKMSKFKLAERRPDLVMFRYDTSSKTFSILNLEVVETTFCGFLREEEVIDCFVSSLREKEFYEHFGERDRGAKTKKFFDDAVLCRSKRRFNFNVMLCLVRGFRIWWCNEFVDGVYEPDLDIDIKY